MTTIRSRWARPAPKKRKADVFLLWERRAAAVEVAAGTKFPAAAEAAHASAERAQGAAAAAKAEYHSLSVSVAAALAAVQKSEKEAAAAAAQVAAADAGAARVTIFDVNPGAAATAAGSAAAASRPGPSPSPAPSIVGSGGTEARRRNPSIKHEVAAPIHTTRPPLPPRTPHSRARDHARYERGAFTIGHSPKWRDV